MPEHDKHVFTRAQYLQILNDSLRRDPRWRPGMAFVFLPPGADAASATAVGCTGPDDALDVYAEIQRIASELIEVRDAAEGTPGTAIPVANADGADVMHDIADDTRDGPAGLRKGG